MSDSGRSSRGSSKKSTGAGSRRAAGVRRAADAKPAGKSAKASGAKGTSRTARSTAGACGPPGSPPAPRQPHHANAGRTRLPPLVTNASSASTAVAKRGETRCVPARFAVKKSTSCSPTASGRDAVSRVVALDPVVALGATDALCMTDTLDLRFR